tara:strand:+ start:93 stop:248 length:156 start_codon:yes stop_codon:yes gene_type:complete
MKDHPYVERFENINRLKTEGITFTFDELECMSDDDIREWIYILEDENQLDT